MIYISLPVHTVLTSVFLFYPAVYSLMMQLSHKLHFIHFFFHLCIICFPALSSVPVLPFFFSVFIFYFFILFILHFPAPVPSQKSCLCNLFHPCYLIRLLILTENLFGEPLDDIFISWAGKIFMISQQFSRSKHFITRPIKHYYMDCFKFI